MEDLISIMVEKTHTYPDGSQYVGEFKDDLFHGQGTLTYANGDQYVGEYVNGKAKPSGESSLLRLLRWMP